MKTSRKIVAMLMIALVAVFAFAGCSSASGKAQNTASSVKQETKSESKSEKSTSSKETASALMIGKITNINGKELTLDLYKSDKDVTEVKDIDAAALTDTGEGETVALQDDVVVESQSNGVTQTAAADNLAVGDMVAISNDGGQRITILEADDSASASEASPSESTDAAENTSKAEKSSTVPTAAKTAPASNPIDTVTIK